MPDTLQNIPLPKGVWVDLYSESAVTVGVKISAQSLSTGDIYLSTKATQPTDEDSYRLLERGEAATNETGDSGAWAISVAIDGKVNVRVV
jgi:hypothetical protein